MASDDATNERIPAFRREGFQNYLQTLRSACTAGSGSIALTAKTDPISAHVRDPFVKLQVATLDADKLAAFNESIPSDDAIMKQPNNKVMDALPHLVKYRAFSFDPPADGSEASPYLFRSDYLTLKSSCENGSSRSLPFTGLAWSPCASQIC